MNGFAWTELPRVQDLPPDRFRMIRALRLVVLFNQARRNPLPELERLLGSEGAALGFLDMMVRCGNHWPEPVIVQPPCCQHTSYDEMLVTDLITAVVLGDRTMFDRLVCDMLNPRARKDLYESCERFVLPFLAARESG